MANAQLREWRKKAHAAVDPLWKSGKMSRQAVYKMLSAKFGEEVHIGASGVQGCMDIIASAVANTIFL